MRPAWSCSALIQCAAGEAITPAAQMIVAAAMRCSPSATPVAIAIGDLGGGHHLDAHFLQRALGVSGQVPPESSAGCALPLRSIKCAPTADRCGGNPICSVSRATPAIAPAISTPVGPAADDDECEQPSPRTPRPRSLPRVRSRAESAGGFPSRPRSASGRVQPLAPVVMAEIRMRRAGREHKVIVGDSDRVGTHVARRHDRSRSTSAITTRAFFCRNQDPADRPRRCRRAKARRSRPDRAAAESNGGSADRR